MLAPFLTDAHVPLFRVIVMSVFMFLIHITSFGENSVLDFTQGYDKVDPSKSHHPLSSGRISVPDAMNFIHWGKALLATFACVMMYLWSPNPVMAILCLFMWYAWGTAYNVGLSKVSILGFLPISICFTFMGGFGWYLSHKDLTHTGLWYLAYVFMVILFQISWSGHLKEMGQAERSNLLIRLGASLTDGVFRPGWSVLYGFLVKGVSIYILIQMVGPRVYGVDAIWLVFIALGITLMTGLLCIPRPYDRATELKRMSLMEIISIYGCIPLLLPWAQAFTLMLIGVLYFYLTNKALWGVSYPKV